MAVFMHEERLCGMSETMLVLQGGLRGGANEVFLRVSQLNQAKVKHLMA